MRISDEHLCGSKDNVWSWSRCRLTSDTVTSRGCPECEFACRRLKVVWCATWAWSTQILCHTFHKCMLDAETLTVNQEGVPSCPAGQRVRTVASYSLRYMPGASLTITSSISCQSWWCFRSKLTPFATVNSISVFFSCLWAFLPDFHQVTEGRVLHRSWG